MTTTASSTARFPWKTGLEISLHSLFWLLLFAMINVEWTQNWWDVSLRPRSPAPLNVLIFPVFFYGHAYFLLPYFFKKGQYKWYVLGSLLLFLVPELLRGLGYIFLLKRSHWGEIWMGRDSMLLGVPSPFTFAYFLSFVYYFLRQALLQPNEVHPAKGAAQNHTANQTPPAYEHHTPLTPEEATALSQQLDHHMETQMPYCQEELSLRDLAPALDSSEKKLSYLLTSIPTA